jgi:hypothetical protein
MKKIIFAYILILISISAYSQIDIGLKGGLNLNFSKEANINGLFTLPNANTAFNSDNDLGFHLGILAEFELPKLGIALRPEILYTKLNYEYNGLIIPESQRLTIQKIDVPVLFAINIKGPFRILIGPSFQFFLNSEFDIDDFREIESDSFSLNAHIGLGLKFDRFDLDIRWEKGLTNSETNFITDSQNVGLNFDTSPNQLILAVAYRFRIK